MATVSPNGEIQLEVGDVIPQQVAVRTDDPPHIVEFIEQINPTISDADELAQAIAHVDNMRREWLEKQGKPAEESLMTPEAAKELANKE